MAWFGDKLKGLFGRGKFDEDFWESLEDLLIEADLGAETSFELIDELRKRSKKEKPLNQQDVIRLLGATILSYIKTYELNIKEDDFSIFLFLGVNGAGKTTSIARFARYLQKEKKRNDIVFAAGDTFRAGAIEQIKIHGERLGLRVVAQKSGADPAAVIFDAIESALSRGEKIVCADTAGRFHNRTSLMEELSKIDRIIRKKATDARYIKFLVIDATTGQNAFRQAEAFNQDIGVDAIILTKFDASAKGGILVPICRKLDIPVAFIGTGEKLDDFLPFDSNYYISGLVGE
ncbi:signal recognition particle-docking protein FtsY [Spirochaetia bacterium 38H-sp]|uniref:Signal recognition particle receptor FtsY n=1 Tax=Rarispira pelagica TaxID=3141764 RepID=A0ABU9UDY7_9SPIR